MSRHHEAPEGIGTGIMRFLLRPLRNLIRAELFPVHDAIDRLAITLRSPPRPERRAAGPAPEVRSPGPRSSVSSIDPETYP